MAGGDYEIEIFGKRLRYSEAKLRELRLGNFFMSYKVWNLKG